MNDRYIPSLVMLLAGAITSITSVYRQMDVLYSLKLLLGVLVVFFIIGIIARNIIRKVKDDTKAETVEDTEIDETVDPDSQQTNAQKEGPTN